MRRYGVPAPAKSSRTRGRASRPRPCTPSSSLDIPQADKERLLALTPASYIGMAAGLGKVCLTFQPFSCRPCLSTRAGLLLN